MKRRETFCVKLAAALMMCAAVQVSAKDKPTIWTFRPPGGPATSMDNITHQLQAYDRGFIPERVADEVCDDILARGLTAGRVNIRLHWFGYGTDWEKFPIPPRDDCPCYYCKGVSLSWHRDDALDMAYVTAMGWPTGQDWDPDLGPDRHFFWHTPWMENGIWEPAPGESGNTTGMWGGHAWTKAFIARYKERQRKDPRIPDPTRFHFDTESQIGPTRHWPDPGVFWGMSYDDRFGDPLDPKAGEPIPGFDGKSLAILTDQYGCMPQMTGGVKETSGNRKWFSWYSGVCFQALDGALEEAAYGQIRDAWPGCLCSNYESSVKMDGVIEDPDDPYAGGRWMMRSGGNYFNALVDHINVPDKGWCRVSTKGSASMQAPVLYPLAPSFLDISYPEDHPFSVLTDYADRMMFFDRHDIESCIHSFGGGRAHEIVPWIPLVEAKVYTNSNGRIHSRDHSRRFLAMLRGHDIREFQVYTCEDDTASNWKAFIELLDQVWSSVPQRTAITMGCCGDDGEEGSAKVSLADREYLTIGSSEFEKGGWKTDVQTVFDTEFAKIPPQLRVHVDARGLSFGQHPMLMSVSAWNHQTNEWVTVGSPIVIEPDGSRVLAYRDLTDDADDCIIAAPGQHVVVRVTVDSTEPFILQTDLLQVVGTDEE